MIDLSYPAPQRLSLALKPFLRYEFFRLSLHIFLGNLSNKSDEPGSLGAGAEFFSLLCMHFVCLPLLFFSFLFFFFGLAAESIVASYLQGTPGHENCKQACIACGQAGIYYHVRVSVWKTGA
jgi:hypothetical protein